MDSRFVEGNAKHAGTVPSPENRGTSNTTVFTLLHKRAVHCAKIWPTKNPTSSNYEKLGQSGSLQLPVHLPVARQHALVLHQYLHLDVIVL